jgi:hypothetical protein
MHNLNATPETRKRAIDRTKLRLMTLNHGHADFRPYPTINYASRIEQRVLALLEGKERLPPPADIPARGGVSHE